MTDNMNRTMQETMRLMQAGDLNAAVAAIQRSLGGGASTTAWPQQDVHAASADCIEGEYEVLRADGLADLRTPTNDERTRRETPHVSNGEFVGHRFKCDAGSLHYKLFIPAGLCTTSAPLIVMLHGCSQTPDDFALGTRMNTLAQAHGYVVAYPAQAQKKNAHRCWNWFRSEDQQRGRGEPAIIAALTRHLVTTHGLDQRRVYVAGLSAGGAMATVLGSTYPDIYAAIGVHSGLPFGAAHDLPSAFAAMRRGGGDVGAIGGGGSDAVPAIVFHGDCDTTVHPCNGAAVVAQSVGTAASQHELARDSTTTTVERGKIPGGRSYTRTIFTKPDGSVAAEQWTVHGGAHAWSGGDEAGSYTDPSGPDASAHMLRFFSIFRHGAIN